MSSSIIFAIHEIQDCLYSIRYKGTSKPELTNLFDQWNDTEYLFDFFEANEGDLQSTFWHTIHGQSLTIDDAIISTLQQAQVMEGYFHKKANESDDNFNNRINRLYVSLLKNETFKPQYKSLNKAYKAYGPQKSWLRIYALRIDTTYIVTGGAIKLTGKMEDRPHTQRQLDNLRNVAQHLKKNYFESDTDFVFDSGYIEI